ncbi:MAG: hypothetical protein DLM68_15015, partial [Hyphomicrobiales bacterium]
MREWRRKGRWISDAWVFRLAFLCQRLGVALWSFMEYGNALPCQSQTSLRCLSVPNDDPTMQRLEDQIQWYESRSIKNQRMFKVLKMIVIFAAALIPFLGHLEKY